MLKTLFGFGLSQQAMIGEPRVPPARRTPGDHGVIHPAQMLMMVAEHRDGREIKIKCTSTHANAHTSTKAVSQRRWSWKNTKLSFIMKKEKKYEVSKLE